MSTDSPQLRELHDRLGSMIDQIGHPDYSLRALVDGLRQVRDVLFDLSETAATDIPEGRGSSLAGVLADGSPHGSTDAKPGGAAPGGAGIQPDDKLNMWQIVGTSQQMQTVRNATIEECAKTVENAKITLFMDGSREGFENAGFDILYLAAKIIRGLKT